MMVVHVHVAAAVWLCVYVCRPCHYSVRGTCAVWLYDGIVTTVYVVHPVRCSVWKWMCNTIGTVTCSVAF